ncbi:MAG: cell division protein FtsZ [Candidatus Marinimicrobia bacterium]|jgi:cell division protein FtsZ|nr:cell division protein FtsZ [Candidatus Neomarinimicrobiota bacterium]MDP6789218.1 cell division protein FtsZ [Candidatus Neomarinimicrobiota bacterium]MDP7072589.1 cell division protein FtsZ [Candidatus Neomarinimicrobiota bacterium]
MLFEFDPNADQQAKLRVVGVGGAGGNAVNRMIQSGMRGVDFIAINTDAQDLENNAAEQKIQIGKNLTKGLGAGAKADIGKAAMEADKEAITALLEGSDMVFITAGMGGGTGTGAAPIIAQISKELGILTVGIITVPFNFEGPKRMNRALNGVEELRKTCDTVIGIPNQKLMSIVDKSTTVVEAFQLADSILNQATKGISDLINVHGLINLDFADVETIMKNMGDAIMGTGQASGEERAVLAAQQAISSPLLDDATISGAQGVLVNITGGPDLTLMEVDDASGIIFEEAGQGVNLIFGAVIDPTLSDEIRVTVIATGFNQRKVAEKTRELVIDEDPPRRKETHILSEQMNVPLHKKEEDQSASEPIPAPAPPQAAKETPDETVIYGNDLDIPAFIRRQHE